MLGVVSLRLAPAIAMGKPVILAASGPFRLAATDFVQVLAKPLDVPRRACVNIVNGRRRTRQNAARAHMDVNAVLEALATKRKAKPLERASAQEPENANHAVKQRHGRRLGKGAEGNEGQKRSLQSRDLGQEISGSPTGE